MSFSSVSRVLSNGTCHNCQIAANKKLEQEKKEFFSKKSYFLNFALYWGGRH